MRKYVFPLAAVLGIFVTFLLFFEQLRAAAGWFVGVYGLIGLFFITIVMDVIIQPISPDLLVFGSTFGGAHFLWAALVAGIASTLAGTIGYGIGHRIGEDGFKRWFSEKHLKKGEQLFAKYGVWAVIVGALSPIPYSAVCWTAGIYRMNFWVFLVTSLATRIPRFFLMALIGGVL